jgi:urease accessory protein
MPVAATSTQHLAALLQLASPMLPVGAFAYSQGIERAVHDGSIANADDASRWIVDLLRNPVAHFEAPVWLRLARACASGDRAAFRTWNERYLASRETAELRAETLQMGASLATLARELRIRTAPMFHDSAPITFPAAFVVFVRHFELEERDGLAAYVWSWAENQVAAAIKAVPLGQVAGQRILIGLHEPIAAAIDTACELEDEDLASAAPGLALASALHESQYSRLFRS